MKSGWCSPRRTVALLLTLWVALVAAPFADVRATASAQPAAADAGYDSVYPSDLAAFKRLRGRLFDLAATLARRTDLFAPRPEDDRTLLRPEIRGQIVSLWYDLIDRYIALDLLAERHNGFYDLKDAADRERAFHLARGIFLTQYRIALDAIAVFEQNPLVDTILNEPDEGLALPGDLYARFKYQYLNVARAGQYAALEAVALGYGTAGDAQLADWAAADSRVILDAGKGPGPLMTLKNGLAILTRFGQKSWFPVQKGVAEWMGHTKVWRPHTNLIDAVQVDRLAQQLVPGDILLERREWYLTNVGIPGFWTHAALFIGSRAQRDALSARPGVADWLKQQGAASIDGLIRQRYPQAADALLRPVSNGRRPGVIEAISPGVSLTSLHHSATCDSLAVLRPRLTRADRAAAVVRAMRYYGRPYDYDFDFGSDTSLVCTELIVKSYLPGRRKRGLDLPLENVMGHMVTPANAFARQFDETFGTPGQQMDLVIFLDGNEIAGRAAAAETEAFRSSWRRPKWHILVQSDGE